MAAIDPSATVEADEDGKTVARATLKLIRQPMGLGDDDSEEDSEDEEYMRALLDGPDSDDDEEEEEEANGGPSDPAKSKKARKAAALKELLDSIDNGSDDEDMEDAPNGTNGVKKADKKGKAKATVGEDAEEEEESDEDSEESDEDGLEMEEFVICTLDPEKVRSLSTFPLTTLPLTNGFRPTNSLLTSPSVKMSVFSSRLAEGLQCTLLVIMLFRTTTAITTTMRFTIQRKRRKMKIMICRQMRMN